MQYCSACYPNKVKSHRGIYFGDLLDILITGFLINRPRPQLPRFPHWCSLTHGWYKLMELCRIVRFTEQIEKKDHYPRSWVVLEEAKRRGIKVEAIRLLGRVSTYYRATLGSKRYY